MQCHLFTTTQTILMPRSQVFAFFSRPRNLEAITPPWLQLRIVEQSSKEVGEDTLLTYRLNVHGVPMTWVSRVTEWAPGERFVDELVSGPYSMWHHTHTFQDFNGGTLLGDRVVYRLPLAPLGDWIAGRLAAADVAKIFEYRRRRLAELLTTNVVAAQAASGSRAVPAVRLERVR
jgi:ligand-binding SRPBCC domain-containing protein